MDQEIGQESAGEDPADDIAQVLDAGVAPGALEKSARGRGSKKAGQQKSWEKKRTVPRKTLPDLLLRRLTGQTLSLEPGLLQKFFQDLL